MSALLAPWRTPGPPRDTKGYGGIVRFSCASVYLPLFSIPFRLVGRYDAPCAKKRAKQVDFFFKSGTPTRVKMYPVGGTLIGAQQTFSKALVEKTPSVTEKGKATKSVCTKKNLLKLIPQECPSFRSIWFLQCLHLSV